MHGYTPLVASEAWLSTMVKMQISSAWTSVFYPLPRLQIRTFAFYHRLWVFGVGPSNAANQILPRLTLVTMPTKFKTKLAITWVV